MSLVMGRVLAERALGAALADLPIPCTPVGRIPFRSTRMLGAGIAMHLLRVLDSLEFRAPAPVPQSGH